jgi:hypothetical protein
MEYWNDGILGKHQEKRKNQNRNNGVMEYWNNGKDKPGKMKDRAIINDTRVEKSEIEYWNDGKEWNRNNGRLR